MTQEMMDEAIGALGAISLILGLTLSLKVVMDATYNALPLKAKRFLDNNF